MNASAWRLTSDSIAQYLGGRRWFGGKGRTIQRADVADVIPVSWPSSPQQYAVARVHVTSDGASSMYQLFLTSAERTRVTDALEDAAFVRGLVDAFARGVSFESPDSEARWVVEREGTQALVIPPHAHIAVSKSEQTNSSVIIGDEAILKLYRKLEAGVNPDVEITRFLTIERAFVHVPVLLGTIRFEEPAGVTIAGMLQELVPGAVDGWTFALRLAKTHMTSASTGATIPFVPEARQLGGVSRAMHEALASGDAGSAFAMRAATAEDVTEWCRSARRTISRAFETLDAAVRHNRIASHAVEARALLDRRAELLQLPDRVASRIGADAGGVARAHGDYHLGQVLRSANDRFLIIDFEGEPARPLEERRAPRSPLRDVAGMLRSFSYAAASAGRDNARTDTWERETRAAFLVGYFAEPDNGNTLLPRSRENVDHLLTLFEAEKVFYELEYELDHRPDWVWIPMHGISLLRA